MAASCHCRLRNADRLTHIGCGAGAAIMSHHVLKAAVFAVLQNNKAHVNSQNTALRMQCSNWLEFANMLLLLLINKPPPRCSVAIAPVCLQSISLPTLTNEWDSDRHPDVVAAATAILRRRISRLADLLRAGEVVVQVCLHL